MTLNFLKMFELLRLQNQSVSPIHKIDGVIKGLEPAWVTKT